MLAGNKVTGSLSKGKKMVIWGKNTEKLHFIKDPKDFTIECNSLVTFTTETALQGSFVHNTVF